MAEEWNIELNAVAPSRGRGSKQARLVVIFHALQSPLHGGVDRNYARHVNGALRATSPLHGGVDRNSVDCRGYCSMRGRPFTGAWIETHCRRGIAMLLRVAPSRGRGSKLFALDRGVELVESPLHGGVDRNCNDAVWWRVERGSPLHGGVDRNHGSPRVFRGAACRPFTGAWIETAPWRFPHPLNMVAPSRGRGSKLRQHIMFGPLFRSPLHGGVDRNIMMRCVMRREFVAPSRGRGSKHGINCGLNGRYRSPLHGGVDRNKADTAQLRPADSRPFTGAWIET